MRTTIGLLTGACVAIVIAFCAAMPGGSLNVPVAWIALTVGAVIVAAGIYQDRREHPLREPWRPGIWDILAITAFALFALRSFLWLVFITDNELRLLNPNNGGDLPLHWQYTSYLARGATFWPDNPITAHGTIGYPFGVDMLNSLLLLAGVDMIRGLVWVGLVASAVTCVMLFRWGRAFVIAGFLFNGGMAGIEVIEQWELSSWQAVDWKSIPLALFVTQRGFLYAFPVGLLLLDSWRTRLRRGTGQSTTRNPLPLWSEALFYATMPIFHLHTFLFLSVLLGTWFVFGPGALRRHWLLVVGFALVPATAQVLWLTDYLGGAGGAFGFQPGWMQEEKPFLRYWSRNFGIFLPLLAWLCVAVGWRKFRWPELPRSERTVGRLFVLPAATVFLACCFFRFAYWEWDNTKLMAWSYLTVLPFLWDIVYKPLAPLLRIPLVILLFFSGFLALIGGLAPDNNGYKLIARSEIDAIQRFIDPLPVEARFASAPDYDHPLVLLGRKLAMGYRGHFSGHGLPLKETETDLNTLMRGEAGWLVAAERLEVDYIFWGIRERAAFPDSSRLWKADCTVVSRGPWGELYRLPSAD